MYNKDRFHADANGCSRGYVNKASCSEESSYCIGGVDLITLVCDLLWPNKSPWVYFYVVLFFILQIFTLSALPSERMPLAIQECFSVLKPGGMLLFRDYGNSPTKQIRVPVELESSLLDISLWIFLIFVLLSNQVFMTWPCFVLLLNKELVTENTCVLMVRALTSSL